MKSVFKSRTIQAAAALITAAITTLILHYTGAIVVAQPAIGAAWSTIVSSVVMAGFRLVTSQPIGHNQIKDEEGKP